MRLKKFEQKDRYGNMFSIEFDTSIPKMESIPEHPGEPKGTDTVPAWLTPGEFVMNAEAVRMFEPEIEEMNNAGRAVQAQQGGPIPTYQSQGGTMPAASIDGNTFVKAAMAVGLPTDNTTLNKLVNLVNQGMSVQEAAKRVANVPQYEANGGPIYAATGGSSNFLTDILKRLEGVASEAYLDSAGKATIGAGSTRGVQMGDTASDEQINSRLAEDIAIVDQDYGQLVTADLNPNQKAAVKSLLFNIGGPQFANSKARAALNAGDFDSFKKEAAEFRKVGDKVIPGLENRRAQELALFDSPVGEDPWGINRRQVSTRDDRVAKLIAAGQPTDLAMQAAMLGQDAETEGEIVTPPPIDRGPPPSMAMTPAEEILARQQPQREAQKAGTFTPTGDLSDPFAPEPPVPGPDAEMLAAQKATREQGVYDPDGNMKAIQEGNAQADILEDQRRRQQVIPPRIEAVPPEGYGDGDFGQDDISSDAGSIPEDTRNAFRKFGDAGGLMGALSRGTDSLNDIKEKFQKENIEQNETFRSLLSDYGDGDFGQGDAMANAGAVPDLKEPPKDLPDNLVLNPETGKVEYKDPSISPQLTNDWAIEGPEGARAQALKLRTAEEEIQTAIANGYGPGDPIFDGALARRDALKGADKKLAELEDQKTKIFTEGELKVTEAEAEKKQEQADKLVDLGLTKEAEKVQKDADDLKDKKKRLEGKSQELVKDDQTEALDPAVPTIEGVSATTPDTKPSAAQVAAEVKKVDDGSAAGTKPGEAEAAVKKAGSDGTDKVEKAEGWLAETFGGLFDTQELKRMAILYAGSRLLGNSHAGSLNWAAEGYLDRVSTHEANVQKLIEKGEYTPASIQNFKKTKDYSVLIKTGTSIAPTGTKETWYTPEGKRIQAEKYKTGKDSYVWSADGGRTAIPSAWHQDASRVKNTDEYNDRVIKESNYLAERLTEIDESSGNKIVSGSVKGGDRKTTYVTGLRPKDAASQVARWAAANGIDVGSAEGYARQAWEMAVADAQADPDRKTKPSDLRPYLNQLKIRQDTGINELFDITAKDGKIRKMDSEKIDEVSRNYLARKGLSGGVSEGDLVKDGTTGFTTRRNRNEVNNFWTEASSRWTKKVAADPSVVDEWAGKALPGETPFFAWAKANVMK